MRITIFDGVLPSSAPLNQTATEKLGAAFGRFADRLGDVEVRFRDLNAGKGGVDKHCRILAYVNGADPVIAEAESTDYYAALDSALGKVRRAVLKKLGHD